jgi:hypothetical protein
MAYDSTVKPLERASKRPVSRWFAPDADIPREIEVDGVVMARFATVKLPTPTSKIDGFCTPWAHLAVDGVIPAGTIVEYHDRDHMNREFARWGTD